MPPLALSDDELDALLVLAAPVPVEQRDAFLKDVVRELAAYNGDVGPGVLHRTARDVQRRYAVAPQAKAGKYR
jgi:hypothetical protein